MTVSSTTSRKTFAGNGTTTSFATSPVVFFDSDDLMVYVTEDATGDAVTLTENTDYTVTGGDGSTGTVSLAGGSDPYGAPASGYTVVINRAVAATQESDFVNNDPSDAEVSEDALDRLTMVDQQILTRLDRTFHFADSDASGADTELPSVADRAGKALGFDDDGDVFMYDPASAVTSASSVSFSQSGDYDTGTAGFKFQERVSVKDAPFNAVGDGVTDDTVAFAACQVFCETTPYKTMYIPNGTYLLTPPSVHGVIYSTTGKLRIEGESVPGTVLKMANNSGGMIRVQTQDFYLSSLSIDMNSKNAGTADVTAGGGLWLEANQPVVRNIRIFNQAGDLPAILIDLANLVVLDDFRIESCETGLEIGRDYQTLYSRISNGVIGECAVGRALKMDDCVGQVFTNVLVEGSPIGAVYLNNCVAVDFNHFQMETGTATLTANSVILLNDCESIHFNGARLNQQHPTTGKKYVQYTGYAYDITWNDVYFLNTTATWKMFAADMGVNNRNLSWKNIRAYSSVAMTGITSAGGSNMTNFSVENWNSGGSGPFTHVFGGYGCVIKNVADDFQLDDAAAPGVLINCSGTITGTHKSDRIGGGASISTAPSVFIGGVNTGVTYTTQEGVYTISGGRVHFDFTLVLSSKGGLTGAVTVTLPKTAATRSGASALVNVQLTNAVNTAIAATSGTIDSNTTVIKVQRYSLGVLASLDGADLNNTTTIKCSGSYEI